MLKLSKSVIKKDDKYLLLKRASHPKIYLNLWDFPGGKHKQDETPKEAVIRETKEETNFDINPGEEIKTGKIYNEINELLFHFFTPTSISGELKLSQDHSKYKWVTKEEMKTLELHPSIELFFKEN